MEDQNNIDSSIKSTIDAVTGLVKAIPVYQDTVQPAAKQIGQSLETVTKTVNIALAPIRALVWGYEQIEKFISDRVSEKLRNVPNENIVTPKPEVVGPAFESLKFSGQSEDLRELYANLIANAMDKDTSDDTHPAFVEVLKNMKAEEARLLQGFLDNNTYPVVNIKAMGNAGYLIHFANYSHLHKSLDIGHPQTVPMLLDNLCRLGILEMPYGMYLTGAEKYDELMNDDELLTIREEITSMGRTVEFDMKVVKLTTFGRYFIERVVRNKS